MYGQRDTHLREPLDCVGPEMHVLVKMCTYSCIVYMYVWDACVSNIHLYDHILCETTTSYLCNFGL